MTAPQSVGAAKADDAAISDQDRVGTTQRGPHRGDSPSDNPKSLRQMRTGSGADYGASTISSRVRTVRQFRIVLADCNSAARYSFVSLLPATPFG